MGFSGLPSFLVQSPNPENTGIRQILILTTDAGDKPLQGGESIRIMADQENNVTLIWAHTPQRWLAFRQLGMAGIDFGVERDLSGMSENDVTAALQELGLSSTVISEFNRLIHRTEIGSWIVTSIPKGVGWANRKWIIGKVVGGYQYRPNLRHDRHTIQVKWDSRDYTEDEITGRIGVNPSGRRLAVQRLNGAVFMPQPDLEGKMG